MQNKSRLKIWVCEYVSAGGLASESLPASLLQEGLLMRDALLADLAALDVDCITSHDTRVPPPSHAASVPVFPLDNAFALWRQQLSSGEIDACWVIAPETGGVLHRMYALVQEAGKCWIGPLDEAIGQTTSKARMADICREAGIPVIPHIALRQSMPLTTLPWYALAHSGWVVKPDDGAGCDFTYYFKNDSELFEFNNKIEKNNGVPYEKLLLQPYLPGKPLSMSVLSTKDQVKVIAGHRQHIHLEDGQFHFLGAGVNQAASYLSSMQRMAEDIHRAIPGLTGYWGADMILTPDGVLTLVEINPRLTTPYIGLSRLLAENPARMILDTVLHNKLPTLVARSSLSLSLSSALPELTERQAT